MDREDIVRMARESGLHVPYWGEDEDPKKDPPRWAMTSPLPPLLERFAALVAASEREARAKVCENIYEGDEACGDWPTPEMCAAAIRARGQQSKEKTNDAS